MRNIKTTTEVYMKQPIKNEKDQKNNFHSRPYADAPLAFAQTEFTHTQAQRRIDNVRRTTSATA